jgi:uncharacterized protein involved in exopolysaccharide biosynthesis
MDKESEINFVALFWIAWSQKYLVIAICLISGVIAAIFALTATPMFRAQIVVTEVRDTGMGGGANGLMGQLGGLASIAGLNLNANGPDAEHLAVLESRGLVQEFVKRFDLTALILGKKVVADPQWFAVEWFRKNVIELKEEKLKGTVVINFEWRDPAVAARWANDFVALANELLRNRAVLESTRNIEYLNMQLPKTTVVEVQHAIYGLIEAETKSLMVAHGRADYAFTVVDPAVPPAMRFSPRRTLIVISGLILGGMLGVLVALARNSLRRRPAIATT